jgi:hypothetical protein
MVKTFDLINVEEKHFFPHLFNKVANLNVELPHLPPPADYLFSSMKPAKKEAFDRWYSVAKTEPFCLREALASYCTSDVS